MEICTRSKKVVLQSAFALILSGFILPGYALAAPEGVSGGDSETPHAKSPDASSLGGKSLAPSSSSVFVESPRGKVSGASLAKDAFKTDAHLATSGWLRTYATAALPADMRLVVPDYYETALESDMRAAINDALVYRGVDVVGDPDASPFRLTYSAEVRTREKSRPRQSRLRLESDAADLQNFGSQRLPAPGNGVRPGISLGSPAADAPRGPALRVTMIVLDGDERVWSGFAEAELGDYRRTELTRVLVNALMRHWGENAELDGAHFAAGPGAGLTPGAAAPAISFDPD